MKRALFSFVLALFSLSSYADSIRLGDPSYGGTGCPAGSAAAALSPDASSLSMLFDRYVVEAGGTTGRDTDRKNCNIAVPVHVPQGLSVSIFKVDYRGFNSLPYGASSQFNVEYFFAGRRGPSYEKRFYGQVADNYILSNSLQATSVIWSACGQDVILRVNSSMFVRTNGQRMQSMSTVDSADFDAGLVYHLAWRKC